jgi:hypothetical protein
MTVMTIGIYTYLYKVNPYWEVASHIFLGAYTGHTLVMAIKTIYDTGVTKILAGDLLSYIPMALGVLLFTRYTKMQWIMRYPLAVLIGLTSGTITRGYIQALVITPLKQTIASPLNNLNNIIILIGFVLVLAYFTFIVKPSPAYNAVSRVGKIWLMGVFGMSIAQDFLPRVGSVVARFDYLIANVPYQTAIIGIVVLIYILYDKYIKK